MAEVNADMNLVLADSVQNAHAQLKVQAQFAEAVKAFQAQLLHDLESSNVAARTYFQRLMETLDAAVQTIIAKVTNAAKTAEADVQVLSHVSALHIVCIIKPDTA